MTYRFQCKAPEAETEKAYKVFNGKSFSYLAKSQMSNVSISGGIMTFTSSEWFGNLHPWLTKTAINPTF